MKNCRIVQPGIIVACIVNLVGCALGDIDVAAVGGPDIYWAKNGTPASVKSTDLGYCGRKSMSAPAGNQWNVVDLCMLKKGYTFIPRPPGYQNLCEQDPFRNNLACRVWRGEVTMQPDAAEAPIQPESNTRSNASSSLWNLLITPSAKPTYPTESELQLQQLQKQIGNAPLPPPPKPFK